MPWRRAAATAPGLTLVPGSVPAETARMSLPAFHRASASWDRAELAVHTNTTRPCTRIGSEASVPKTSGSKRT